MVKAREKTVAAVGNFDGVHLGHQALLDTTIAFAGDHDARAGVVLFDPHPRRYFRPEDPPFLLTSPAHRDELLRTYGAAQIFSLTFDEALAATGPEEFVTGVLKEKLRLDGVVAGADFHFGAFRAGDATALQQFGKTCGLKVKIVDLLLKPDTEKFGSSATRNALRAGNVKAAAELLGRSWSVRGPVLEGRKVGRTLGFPTANMVLGDVMAPRKGVYATRVRFAGKTYDAVSNYGRRPTVGESAELLETFLFDFNSDLYGAEIEVEFIEFLREEKKFDGLEALKSQIQIDCERAKAVL